MAAFPKERAEAPSRCTGEKAMKTEAQITVIPGYPRDARSHRQQGERRG